jgi:hypothetical protein
LATVIPITRRGGEIAGPPKLPGSTEQLTRLIGSDARLVEAARQLGLYGLMLNEARRHGG